MSPRSVKKDPQNPRETSRSSGRGADGLTSWWGEGRRGFALAAEKAGCAGELDVGRGSPRIMSGFGASPGGV